MAGSPYVQCVGPSYHLMDRKAAVQTAVNCFPERLEGDNWTLKSAPGLIQGYNDSREWRGSIVLDGVWYAVVGRDFSLMSKTGYPMSTLGFLTTSTGFVGMAANQSQIAIVDGPNLYIYNYSTLAFTQVSVSGWRGSDDVHQIDGYFIFVDPDTDQFYISAIDDGTNLNALDFSSADSSPDQIITHRVNHKQLWLFGKSNSTEIWIDSGDTSFPFVRYQSYTLDIGCVGKRAAINAADTLFWIGITDRGTGIVYMASGNQPQRVSNTAVEESLRSSPNLSEASMWAYQTEGHEFVGIEVPGLDKTWVYDVATQMWHERGEWSAGWSRLGWRFVTSVLLEGYAPFLWAGAIAGPMGQLDNATNTYILGPLVRERTWPHLVNPSMEPISYMGLEVLMASGNGGNVTLEISNDGGYTFGAPLLRSLGATGRYMQRVRWLGLGTAYDRVFRIRCSDNVPFALHAANLDT